MYGGGPQLPPGEPWFLYPAYPASVEIALCGYGAQVPRAYSDNGVGRFAQLSTRVPTEPLKGFWNATVVGNDVILPKGTYYTITTRNANDDITQIEAFQFNDGEQYDVDGTEPFDPTQPPGPLPPAIVSQIQTIMLDTSGYGTGDGTSALTFKIPLNLDATFDIENAVAGNLYTVIIQQDGTGNRSLDWPENFRNPSPINPEPNGVTVQTFVFSDDSWFYPISSSTWYIP